MARDAVFPAGRQDLYTRNKCSAAVRSGGFLFVSGQVGSREDGSPEPELEAQIALAFRNLAAVLDAAGCSYEDVQDATLYLTDPEAALPLYFKAAPPEWLATPYPALTAVGVTWLSGFQFEIKVVARLPEESAHG